MAKQQRDLGKEVHWRGVLEQFSASGLSVRAFCRREQRSEANFYAWRRILAERDNQLGELAGMSSAQVTTPPPAPHAAAFVPVHVASSGLSVRKSADELGRSSDSSLALELRGGRTLRLPLTTPPAWLAELVLALEAGANR